MSKYIQESSKGWLFPFHHNLLKSECLSSLLGDRSLDVCGAQSSVGVREAACSELASWCSIGTLSAEYGVNNDSISVVVKSAFKNNVEFLGCIGSTNPSDALDSV